MRQKDIRPAPARIEFKGMKFLITDRPSDLTMHSYILVSYFYRTFKLYYFVKVFYFFIFVLKEENMPCLIYESWNCYYFF